MSIAEAQRIITPEDLLAMPDSETFELVDGEIVEKNVGALSTFVEVKISGRLNSFSESTQLGYVWPGTQGIQCFPDKPGKIRKPDAFFIRKDRFSPELFADGYITVVPDLAVEVISSGDNTVETDEKVEEYLQAGVRLVWVINPETRVVLIHRVDGSIGKLHDHEELDGEDVLPGFRCRVGDLLPTK